MIIATISRYPYPTLHVGPFPTVEALEDWCKKHRVTAGYDEVVSPDVFDAEPHRIWTYGTTIETRQ